MSHAVDPNSGHSSGSTGHSSGHTGHTSGARTRTTTKPGAASITDVVKVFTRLLPKQLKDEAQLAFLVFLRKLLKK